MKDWFILHKIIVTIQVSFRPEGEIFRVMQISPRSTRRNDNHPDSYYVFVPDFAGKRWMPQLIAVAKSRRNELRHPIDKALSMLARKRLNEYVL